MRLRTAGRASIVLGVALTLATSSAVAKGPAFPATPNDTLFEHQWGMRNIQAPEAWQLATGRGIDVAIVDSGIDLQHPDFGCRHKIEVLPGSNIAAKNPDYPDDRNGGHGTHVAGIIGACTNNRTGVVGVAPEATLVPFRIVTRISRPAPNLDRAIAEGIELAIDSGAHVLNLSVGDGPPFSHRAADGYPLIEAALERARDEGMVIAVAAGNFAQPTCEYPAFSRHVICAVATDRNDLRAVYSDAPVNFDPRSEEPGLEPVVGAPGGGGPGGFSCDEGVLSTYPIDNELHCVEGGYAAYSGTSMAAPHVAGVAALLYERLGGVRSRANADLIVQTIVETADDLYTPGWDPIVGFGRLNALAAVRALPAR